ncbi:two-component sensor kinase [Escherichia coli]|uniref:Two-component sensor kinase n=1 Tax=Escherichia coli TaxID=562 RepID=A0A377CFB5_ECOLX|nr:two-component sensor kinase [Escherichia coli]
MRHSLPYRMLRKRPMKLSTTVILMVSAVLFSVLLVVHLIYFSQISDMTRDGLANKALAVARTLADSPEIRQGLQKKPQESGIQAIAEAVRKRNDLLLLSLPICKVFAIRILKPSVLVSHLKVMTSLKR